MTPHSHLKGSRCRRCRYASMTTTQRQFLKRARLVHGRRYNYTKVAFATMKKRVRIVCSRHGEFTQIAARHLQGNGCYKCAKPVHDTASFIRKAKQVHGDRYDYSTSKYNGSLSTISVICRKHGKFIQAVQHHIRGGGCQRCKTSRLENAAALHLELMGFQFETQTKVTVVNADNELEVLHGRFDFTLTYKGERMVIETDGFQHFHVQNYFKQITLYEQILRDRSKNLYCKKTGVHMLRIAYTELKSVGYWINEFIARVQTTLTGELVYMCSNPDLYNSQMFVSKPTVSFEANAHTKQCAHVTQNIDLEIA